MHEWQVPYFAVRGYNSASEMYSTGKEFESLILEGVKPLVLYLATMTPVASTCRGSPSATCRCSQTPTLRFAGSLSTSNQVREPRCRRTPPRKPTGGTALTLRSSTRKKSWELDALDPSFIDRILRREISGIGQPEKMAGGEEEAGGECRDPVQRGGQFKSLTLTATPSQLRPSGGLWSHGGWWRHTARLDAGGLTDEIPQ